MIKKVRIGNRWVGEGESCFVVAEIGINHNGNIEIARKLISAAALAGCDAVKFQKRTLEICIPQERQNIIRETPWGHISYLEYRKKIEFDFDEYKEIDRYCKKNEVIWFVSCWDEPALDFIQQFNPPCYKIASPCLTNDDLLRHHRRYNQPIILSTGMSTLEQIDHAVDVLGTENLILMHCNSSYPAKVEELNLSAIQILKDRYKIPIGYSGHEVGLATSVAASVLGACIVERHITLDRAMWGSDQVASVEPHGFARLVRDIHVIEKAMGDGVKRVYESEIPIKEKLRRVRT